MVSALFKKNHLWDIICLLCGLFLIGLFVFIGYVDSEATVGGLLTGIILGVIICLSSIVFLFYNYKAYLCIDENGKIYGKYHYFRKISCHISEVDFAIGRNTTLIVQLKDGKIYTITGIENPREISSIIRQNMSFDNTKPPKELIEKLNSLMLTKKKGLIYVGSGLVLMIVYVFVVVFMISGKELYEFSKMDWIVFVIMGLVEIATIIITFRLARETGLNNIPIEKLKYTIRRTIVETKLLLPGFVIAVYTDYDYTGRITVFGYPHQSDGYYTLQEFDNEYNLLQVYTSDTYDNQEQLKDEIYGLFDITNKFLQCNKNRN